jgi:phosphatidylethanolamine/phosphatidyl-N-methylethanolamine N-methyltransferase
MPTAAEKEPSSVDMSCLFLRKFLRHGTRVASFTPSSRSLAAAMCRWIDPARPQTIVEVGAGTGAVTVAAAATMHPNSRLIAIELDPDFAAILRSRCPHVLAVCGNVRDIDAHLTSLAIDRIDVLLSGLPVPSLPRAVNRALLKFIAERGREAVFSQLTLMPWVYWRMYGRLFEQVDFQLVVGNLPPGGVYHCRRLRADYAEHLPGSR